MIIRLEQSFIETVSQLNSNFSEGEKQKLAASIESKYDDILSIIKDQEGKKANLEPKIIELGSIGSRLFSLSLYYNGDSENDDIPLSITQLLPTISPVRIDIMSKLHQKQQQQQQQQTNGNDSSYLKAGQVYDDGDIHSRYVDEIIEEDDGMRPLS
jgi:glycyl-tRNA synthetase (class II)